VRLEKIIQSDNLYRPQDVCFSDGYVLVPEIDSNNEFIRAFFRAVLRTPSLCRG